MTRKPMKRICRHVAITALAAALVAGARPAAAQESNFAPSLDQNGRPSAGWSFTPSIAYSGVYDDNVLIQQAGDQTSGDFLNVISPRVGVDLSGRRGQFNAYYEGGFLLYRQLNTLNSYDQHVALFARRLVTKHVALFIRDTAAAVPTTEYVGFVGVPFVRTGSKINDVHGGVEAAFSKRLSLIAQYNFQVLDFQQDRQYEAFLNGGHSNGATLALRYKLDDLTTLTGDYDLQHATIAYGGGTFDVQNWWVGAERKLSDVTRVFGALGVSRLGVSEFGEAQTGPAWRLGADHQFSRTVVNVSYNRSYVPVFGFGGTTQNEEVNGHVRVPVGRRAYAQGGIAWRRNDPLTAGALSLTTWWTEALAGYQVTPWLKVEGFYTATHQTIDRPGGDLNRNLLGFQVVTAKPMRIR